VSISRFDCRNLIIGSSTLRFCDLHQNTGFHLACRRKHVSARITFRQIPTNTNRMSIDVSQSSVYKGLRRAPDLTRALDNEILPHIWWGVNSDFDPSVAVSSIVTYLFNQLIRIGCQIIKVIRLFLVTFLKI
jgi:hypothetical protein